MDYSQARFNMVEQQIRPWDVLDFNLLDVLGEIPREAFVADEHKPFAYADRALPLGNGFVMLEPRIVARLIQGLALQPTDRVLEVATGSGYATAVLAKMAASVLTVDTDAAQQARAAATLNSLGYHNISFQVSDGLAGVPDQAPYDAIYIGGSCEHAPEALLEQLAEGGRLVVVTGDAPVMQAKVIRRDGTRFIEKALFDTCIPRLGGSHAQSSSRFHF